MRDTCPVCGRGTVEVFEADDGELGTRMVDHIPCVRVMQANSRIAAADRDRYRDLFNRANAEKRFLRDELKRAHDAIHDPGFALGRALAELDAERAKRCGICKHWAEYTVNGKPLPRPDGWCSLQEFGTTEGWVCGDWEAKDD